MCRYERDAPDHGVLCPLPCFLMNEIFRVQRQGFLFVLSIVLLVTRRVEVFSGCFKGDNIERESQGVD